MSKEAYGMKVLKSVVRITIILEGTFLVCLVLRTIQLTVYVWMYG